MCVCACACVLAGQETNSVDSKNDDSKASASSSSSVSKIWRKRSVTPEQLFKVITQALCSQTLELTGKGKVILTLGKGI